MNGTGLLATSRRPFRRRRLLIVVIDAAVVPASRSFLTICSGVCCFRLVESRPCPVRPLDGYITCTQPLVWPALFVAVHFGGTHVATDGTKNGAVEYPLEAVG